MTPVLLMVRELGIGGTERQLTEMARALDRTRFEPHVACFRGGGFRAGELKAAAVPILELEVRSFRSMSAVNGLAQFGRYVRRQGVRLVHTFDAPSNLFGVLAARLAAAPRVLSSQRSHRDLLPRGMRHLVRLTDQMVDGVVVNSMSVHRHLVEDERVPAARVHVCHNGTDFSRFQPGERRRGAVLAMGVVCALRPEKDIATLLRAFAQIRRPGVKLAVVGSGSAEGALRGLAAELRLGDDCHFEPATAEVPARLRALDVFVLPSLSESFSNSLVEAMACGCCAVASRAGGNPEIVSHERTGLLFDPGDVGGLAACLDRLIGSERLRGELAEAGTAEVRRKFSTASAARRMEEIYDGVLAG